MKRYFSLTLLLVLVSGIFSSISAQETKSQILPVTHWLTAGPVAVEMPAFYEKNNLMGKPFHPADLLKFQQKPVTDVKAGTDFLVYKGKKIVWEDQDGNDKIFSNDNLALRWQAFYIQADRYIPLKIKVTSTQDFELFVNGKLEVSDYSSTGKKTEKEASLKLDPGKYLVLIKSLYQKKKNADWEVSAKVIFDNKFPKEAVNLSTSDEQFLDLSHILLGKQLKGTQISDDGSLIMLNFSETYPPDGKTVRWFEIKRISDGKIIFNSLHSNLRQAEWVPDSHKISYVTKDGVSEALMCYNLDTHKEKVLMDHLKRFSGYEWDHNGKYLIFSIMEKYDHNYKEGVYMVRGMEDRWPNYRMRTQLYMLTMNDLSVKQLTYGYLTNNLQDISPNDQDILISQSFPDYAHRPYTKQVMMQMNLNTMKVDTLWDANFGGYAGYSPDGKQLLVMGSPSMFHSAGDVLKKGKIPNDYDMQAYLFNLKDHKVTPITRDFKPSIMESYWNPYDKQIYFLTTDQSDQKIYRYNPDSKEFTKLNTSVEVISRMSFAARSPWMSFSGTSISTPATGWIYNLSQAKEREISNPEKSFFKNVKFGKTETWNFKDKQGWTIEGRVYYPPDYNPNKKYPLVVYYYGGTVPTPRSFGGRYPMNLFASMGYIVYVLQPSGTIGYGQKFSALHVNGWGKENARDIIEGVKKFVQSHPQVEADNIGCLGASYGGYMTMWLQTQTNIFKTAVDHAGISSIASYWGQGYWGYLYSSVASANSFPWNNWKLYVNQSPLFNANKVHTPMLLLQGTADTNVPTGQSIQFYTALKLLGVPVKFVEIKGQNHHILNYKDRIRWQKTIFAWFAKYLKNQPEWWNALYPPKDL